MKRPYFNRQQRYAIHCDTWVGANLMLHLSIKKFLRSIYKSNGWFAMRKAERSYTKLIDFKSLGIDLPKKWWQIF